MTVEKRFALITDDGRRLYPYKKSQRTTNRYGFALTVPGEADRHGGGYYTDDIEEVIRRLVYDGWSVRAKTVDGPANQRHGTYGIGKRTIIGYEIDQDLIRVVHHAPTKPLSTIRSSPSISRSSGSEYRSESPVDELSFRAIKTRRGQARFRETLISELPQCRISGSEVFSVLEAAHIIPHFDESNYSLDNGLLLRADIHTLFDLNLIGIDVDGAIHVSSILDGTEYAVYRGKRLAGPRSPERTKNLKERFRRWFAPAVR